MEAPSRKRRLMIGRGGLVCRCHQVYLPAIREAIAQAYLVDGAQGDPKLAVKETTQASTGCGACECIVDELIEEHREQAVPSLVERLA